MLFDKRVDSRLHLGNKLQLKVSFYGMVVNTKAPDLDKPSGQDVQGKPSQEFDPTECNRLFNSPVTIIFCNKGYFTAGNIQDALVGNGYPMGILSQVFYYVFSVCQRRCALNNPFCLISLLYLVVKKGKLVLFT